MHLHRAFGDTEPHGDLLLGQTFNFTQDHNLAAPGGQSRDRLREEPEFLVAAGGLGRVGSIIQDGPDVSLTYRVVSGNLAAADHIDGQTSGHLEKKRFRGPNGR